MGAVRIAWRCFGLAIPIAAAWLPSAVYAKSAALSILQLKHRAWRIEDGAPVGMSVVAQAPDGILLVGTRDGLYRFDGLTFEKIPADRRNAPNDGIASILTARDGTIWVGYADGGIATVRGGILTDMASPAVGGQVGRSAQTLDGAIWFALLQRVDRPLVRFKDGVWRPFTSLDGLPRAQSFDLLAASDGALWITTYGGVYVLPRGASRFERWKVSTTGHSALTQDRDGAIWLSDDLGTRAIAGTRPKRCPELLPTPAFPRGAKTVTAGDGSIWGSVAISGLFRVRPTEVTVCGKPVPSERFDMTLGLSSDRTAKPFVDREGTVWVPTSDGLDQFRTVDVINEPLLRQIAPYGTLLLAGPDGTVYVAAADAVYRIRPRGLPEPIAPSDGSPWAICSSPNGTIGIVFDKRVLLYTDGKARWINGPPPAAVGFYDCAWDATRHLWVTAEEDGAYRLEDGRWHQYFRADGEALHPQRLLSLSDRRLVTNRGPTALTLMDPSRPVTLTIPGASASDDIRILEANADKILVGGTFGVARFAGGWQLIKARAVPSLRGARGLVWSRDGSAWTINGSGILQFAPGAFDRAFAGKSPLVPARVFGRLDGVPGGPVTDARRNIAIGGDGRLWFATTAGVVWVDPASRHGNPLAPIVTVKGVLSDGRALPAADRISLIAGTRRLEIDFAAASLRLPERVQVRYQLEGIDTEWVDPGKRRAAFYTNLAPGTYRFRVIAANESGLWNRRGETMEIELPPTFLQSRWALALGILLLTGLAWLAYRFRVRQLAGRLHAKMEARMAERERIARELHDTLLQGFQGLMLRFQAVAERLAPEQSQRQQLDQALDSAERILIEGRDKVRRLRMADERSLADILASAASEMLDDQTGRFRITVEGTERPLVAIVREELAAIGCEAIRNAIGHSRADRIECSLVYDREGIRLGVRDNGCGLTPEVSARGGRTGHYGLVGMKERADHIGATFWIASLSGSGTEVSVRLPAALAYCAAARAVTLRTMRRLVGEGA